MVRRRLIMDEKKLREDYELMKKEQDEDQVIGYWGNLKANYLYENDLDRFKAMLWKGTLKPYLLDLDIRAGIFENQTRLSILNEAKKRGEMPDQNKEFLEYVGQMEAIQNQSKELTTQYVIEDLTFLSEPFRAATWYEDEEEETIAQ